MTQALLRASVPAGDRPKLPPVGPTSTAAPGNPPHGGAWVAVACVPAGLLRGSVDSLALHAAGTGERKGPTPALQYRRHGAFVMATTESQVAPTRAEESSFEQIYARMRLLARRERHRFGAGNTYNTTALVHEVYLDVCAAGRAAPPPRDFFGYAARAMRNLLIDHARRRLRPKHGGDLRAVELDDTGIGNVEVDASQALELDAALRKLAASDARAAEVVELHYFGGLDLAHIAELLGVSERTINRDWRAARAWLQLELQG